MKATQAERKLTKVEHELFTEYYEGTSKTGSKITCILDKNCVRYTVTQQNGQRTKQITRREYWNGEEARCFARATAALEN